MRISDWSSDVCSSDLGSASTVIDGTVDGNVSLTSTATNNAYDYASTPTGYTYSDTNVGAGGAATGAVGATGTVDGNFTAIGDNSVVLTNAGTIKGNVTGTSRRSLTNYSGKVGSSTTTSATLIATTSQSESTSRIATNRSKEHTSELQPLMRITHA